MQMQQPVETVEMRQRDEKRHLCRFESGLWAPAECRYDAGKKECKGLHKARKKMRFWLYGVRFGVEIYARTLVYQLNLPANDLPGAMVTRWIAWIRLFDFDVVHVLGKQQTAADGLSRRKGTEEDVAEAEEENPQEVVQFLDQQLFACRVTIEDWVSVQDPASTRKHKHSQAIVWDPTLTWKPIQPRVRLVPGKYTGKWEEIVCILETLELRQHLLTDKQRQVFRHEATKLLV
jgi:hypothetical protein